MNVSSHLTEEGKETNANNKGATSKAVAEEKKANGVKKPPQNLQADKNKNVRQF